MEDNSELGSIVRNFANYLSQERRLSEASLHKYLPVVHQFLEDRFGTQSVMFEKIRQVDVSGFVLRYTKKFSRARAKGIVTALRSFFVFLYLRGYISTDLAGVVPTVANWKCATLPNWISQEEVEHLLQSCDQRTSQGQRDYTILSDSHGPRMHDLRHRFAVSTLINWYREGVDIEQRLYVLSTFLGHVKASYTYWYLVCGSRASAIGNGAA